MDEEESAGLATPSTQNGPSRRRRASPSAGRGQARHQGTPPQALSAGDGHVRQYTRVSPYPNRVQAPPTLAGRPTRASSAASPAAPPAVPVQAHLPTRASPAAPPAVSTFAGRPTHTSPAPPPAVSTSAGPPSRASPASPAAPSTEEQHRLQLIVRPIVKSTVGQRDTSGETLDDFAVNDATFQAILHKLWLKFSPRVKSQAVKQEGAWIVDTPVETAWHKVMQFKGNQHLVDSAKTEQAWDRWVISTGGETIRLMIYEYGMAITKAQDLEEFLDTCIRPAFTDRSGAAAESSLQDVVAQLQEIWKATFQADTVVWRMWVNHIMRGLNRSMWGRAILDYPPSYVANLLKPAELPAEMQLAGLSRSALLALEVVNAAIEDNRKLNETWKAHGERLNGQHLQLESRKSTIEAFLADSRPPPLSNVIDHLPGLTNVDDIEHQE